MTAPLWTTRNWSRPPVDGWTATSPSLDGVSIDSRSIAAGDIFVAIAGESRDGHEFAAAALKSRGGAGDRVAAGPRDARQRALLVVDEPLAALQRLGAAARARANAAQSSASPAASARPPARRRCAWRWAPAGHPCLGLFLQQPVGRAAVAGADAPRREFARVRDRHEPPGEITPLTRLVRPHVAIVTTIAASHLGYFASLAAIADAKAEIFAGVEPGGAAVINRDSEFFDHLSTAASGRRRPHRGLRRARPADVRLESVALHETCSCVTAEVMGETVSYRLGAPGRHLVLNSLAVLAAAQLAGGDLARAAWRWRTCRAAEGQGRALQARGGRRHHHRHRRELQCQSGFGARRPSAARPGQARPRRPAHRGARRHAGAWRRVAAPACRTRRCGG
jgi:UDP-N-acetylmuramoyl-tripeptide--D-alanyl-D-alanine ligase